MPFEDHRGPEPYLANRDLLDGYEGDYFDYGAPLYQASIKGDWESAVDILVKRPELVRYSLTENGETALHIAASANKSKQVEEFVKNLVDRMEKDDLTLQNNNYNTALYLAVVSGNLEIVKIMMAKNEILDKIPGGGDKRKMMPLDAAVLFGTNEVVKYLYDHSRHLRDDHWNNERRGWFLYSCVLSDMFDIALEIVKLYKTLGMSNPILEVLARKPKAFSETKSSIIKRTVYSVCAFIGLKVEMPEKESQALQLLRTLWCFIETLPKKEIDDIIRGPPDAMQPTRGWALQVIQLKKIVSEQLKELENTFKPCKDQAQLKNIVFQYVLKMHTETQNIIKEENRTRSSQGDQALKLEKIIFDNIVKLHDDTQKPIRQGVGVEVLHGLIQNHISIMRRESMLMTYSSQVLFIAAEMGNTKFVVEFIRRYPELIWKVNDQNQSIFHVAVKHRHVGIYNLLYEIGTMKDMITLLRDKNGNNMLHLVGKIVNRKQLENVSGVALEMQRELLWFQEVESMIPPSMREERNSDGLTPHELFTIEHKDMVTQGERWMKEIASQCMVVAALIATMVFAAAFTVPGGFDQNNGIPMYYSETTFKVFVVSDAISLFSSSASILYMFLSVFTSRYAESDFLKSLPRKLIIGLSYLFLSMTSMIIAFCISFFVLYQKGMLWIPILISGFAVVPIGIYVKAQYVLFADVIRSTYGSRYISKPKKHVLYYKNPTV